ncbi:LuxR family transcriptional regulator [Antrihabitans sp. YC3-6]|uniref:LuxR family transcriptional regulator n=1 Tax=Antrihabitans stalagmiti TaxID=2799499 RepID=A0A934U378_9NOCA|nr:LuxR C-terminal-related transcriptional regulator [Antrihabitans stalagmiti]MBJ8339480.1 LuxR family transcriptional regulator [Antrihabitans stalagmiti]
MPQTNDVSAATREILREVDGGGPIRLMLRGQSGTGKSAMLAAVRDRLRARGLSVSAEPSAALGGAALVVDDLHSLPTADVVAVRTLLDDSPAAVVVVATEPRAHDTDLRALAATFARRGRVVDMRSLSTADIVGLGRSSAVTVTPAQAARIRDLTNGIYGAVVAALGGGSPEDSVVGWVCANLRDRDIQFLSTLAMTATGIGLDVTEVSDVNGIDESNALTLIDRVRASALVTDPDLLLPIAAQPLRTLLGDHRFLDVQQRVLTARLDRGVLRIHTATKLAEIGLRDARLAEYLCNAAESADPAVAAQLYSAAVQAGIDPRSVEVKRCEAAARSGDSRTAADIAESILARADDPDCASSTAELGAAVRVLAGVWADRGTLVRSAELYEWLGTDRVGNDGGSAAAVMLVAGRPEAAAAMKSAKPAGPPTDLAAGITMVGDALAQSMSGSGQAAVNTLARSLSLFDRAEAVALLPISPAAAAVQLSLHCGDLARADALLDRVDEKVRPGTRMWHQHRLLSAWTAMLGGDEDRARSIVESLAADDLGNRDLLLDRAIRVGLARRSGDHGALVRAWEASHRVIDEITVDVFSLLALGELWLAAVRIGDVTRVAHLISEADELLRRLGEPAAWSNTFHWYGVQAALLSEDPPALVPHALALKRAAESAAAPDTYAAALAAAGSTWLRVLRQEAQLDDIEKSARILGSIGLPWDGARLASEAALRAADTETATALLQVARSLRQPPRRSERGASTPQQLPTATPRQAIVTNGPLSDRECEVADLLVLGLTYREVGSRLYISAKTVEHHVARIRRRLGAGSRSELLSMLRAMGHGRGDRAQLV